MADFMEFEAVESDEEQELAHAEKKRAGTKKRKAEVMDESDEEEDDGDENVDDLIDDDSSDDCDSVDSDGEDGPQKRKKRDDDDFDDRLEDDDYDLLEENLGISVERKRFKRLRQIEEDESDEEDIQEPGEVQIAIANELIEDGSDDEIKRKSEVRHGSSKDDASDEDEEDVESDYDDFIVDDDGKPIAGKKPKNKAIYSNAALQEAQDIFGVELDYDEFGKYDEEDEYTDEDDESQRCSKTNRRNKVTKKTIFEIYEPCELKRGHFTDVDNEIRCADIPERMQLRSVPVTPVPEGSNELDLEADWIYRQAFTRPTISTQDAHLGKEAKEHSRKGPRTVGKIKNALDFMRNQQYEVPFISFYRKEYVLPELNINDLWKVYKFDAQWCQLQQRKQNLLRLFEKMRDYQVEEIMKNPDAALSVDVRVIKDEDIERVKNVETSDELNDVHRHFMLYYSQDIPSMQERARKKEKEGRSKSKTEKRRQRIAQAEENGEELPSEDENDQDVLKQAVRTGPYAICRKAGLNGVAKKFGLSPEHFAENLRANRQRHEIEQEPIEPAVSALDYCCETLKTPGEVIQAAQLMVAYQLSREPLVRKCVREIYMKRAKLTVRPTKIGIKVIDEHHPIYTMKYLKDKPVRNLVGDQFLKLSMAEAEKLITIQFSDDVDGNTCGSYIDEIKQLHQKNGSSKTVQDWNVLRTGSVDVAFKEMVIPDLKKELRANLLAESKEYIMRVCCRKMYNWINVAPYTCKITEDNQDWNTSKGLRVMGLSYVPDYTQAAFACLVKPNGEFGEYLRLPHILKRKNNFKSNEKILKEADLRAIRNFMATQKPHVVAIGGESREAIMLAEDVRECIKVLHEEEDFPEIRVEICENDLAKIIANSNKGKKEFKEYPELLREAISVARRLQDPLIEFSQLCTQDEEILCLKFNYYQDQLAKEELLEGLYTEFTNRVNEVGVDVNKAVQMSYWSNIVQFVCGFGPRKSQALIRTMKQKNQRLENRTQLVTTCHMGPKIFINCAGFIKIDTNSLGDSTEAYVEILDGSRVHPETYAWARKMALDALEYNDEDENPADALEEIIGSPDKLNVLDLDAYAEELKRQGFGNKCMTLYDIRAELNSRYKDLRTLYQSPNPTKLFDMLTKETTDSFFIGKLIIATVSRINTRKPQGKQLDQANPIRNDTTGFWQCPLCLVDTFSELSSVWNHLDAGDCPGKATGVMLRLDNGISGFIHVKNVSDKHVENLADRVRPGQSIHCRITKIEVERFSIECTSKSSDLADENHQFRPQLDWYYDKEAKAADSKVKEAEQKLKQRKTYMKRVIVHPSFHNITYEDAEKMMRTMDQGEAIIRPSSKGENHLTVTWKVIGDILHHIDVIEIDKENAFSLGKTLTIGNDKFEDLDEIISRHVIPMASYASELISYKHFKVGVDGCRQKATCVLIDMKKINMNGIPYIISASKSHPGNFLLSYLPRVECKHEYISVAPNGFKFRNRTFPKLDGLFHWFKKHFSDPIQQTASSATPGIVGMNQEMIRKVAQNLPQTVLNTLSQVANRTHRPLHASSSTAADGYAHHNTTYTPSGQTPSRTPYQTLHNKPHHAQPSSRYGHQTPNHCHRRSLQTRAFLSTGSHSAQCR